MDKVKRKIRKERKSKKEKQEKEIRLILIFMIVVVSCMFLFYFIIQKMNSFNYLGISFKKTKLGNINFYVGKFPLSKLTGNAIGDLSVYFREDPRKLENIKIDGEILLKRKVALAVGAYELRCEDKVLAGATLSRFLNGFGISSFGATTNKTEALELNRTYVSCNDTAYSVIIFKESNESKITKIGKDCYQLDIKDCEIMNVTERFMIGFWRDLIK